MMLRNLLVCQVQSSRFKDLLPVIVRILFTLVRFWYFSVRRFLYLSYTFTFDLFFMQSIISRWASLNTLRNSCDKSFTLMLQFRNLCLASFFVKTNCFWYSMVIRVTFCDLIGGFILNDFGVRSSVKHFFKKINWFFDTAALAFLLLEFRTMKLKYSKTRDLFDYLFWLSYLRVTFRILSTKPLQKH